MASRSEARVFGDEENPTGKFETETLDALVARSLDKSVTFNASLDGPALEIVTPPEPPADPKQSSPAPTRSSPEFLGKSSAVLVLPQAEAQPAPPPTLQRVDTAVFPLVQPVAAPVPARVAPPVVRVRPRGATRSAVIRRPSGWRHVLKLTLLAMVVACQPWWWNVGDLHGRSPAPAPAAATATLAK